VLHDKGREEGGNEQISANKSKQFVRKKNEAEEVGKGLQIHSNQTTKYLQLI